MRVQDWSTEEFRGELLTKVVKLGLFILLKQDIGQVKIMRACCGFV